VFNLHCYMLSEYIFGSGTDFILPLILFFLLLEVKGQGQIKPLTRPTATGLHQLYGITYSVTCHPTQVNAPHVNRSQKAGTWMIYLSTVTHPSSSRARCRITTTSCSYTTHLATSLVYGNRMGAKEDESPKRKSLMLSDCITVECRGV